MFAKHREKYAGVAIYCFNMKGGSSLVQIIMKSSKFFLNCRKTCEYL